MIKGSSYSWSSVRSFHAHIAKQVELYRLEWSDTAEIRNRANTFFKHSDLRTAPTSRVTATPPSATRSKQDGGGPSTTRSKQDGGDRKPAVVSSGITPVLALAKRTKTPMPLNTSVVFALRTILCSTALRDEIPFLPLFDNPSPLPNFLRSIRPRTCQRRMSFRTHFHTQERRASFHLPSTTQSSNVSAVIRHILASRSDSPNAFGSKIPVYTALKINMWEDLLLDYHD